MRSLDCDWNEFFEALSVYVQLSTPARQQFIQKGPYSSGIRAKELEPSLREFVSLGLFSSTGDGKIMTVDPRFRGFCKALRAIQRSRIDIEPDAASMDAYLADNFTRDEWTALFSSPQYWQRDRRALYGWLSSLARLNDFLRSEDGQFSPGVQRRKAEQAEVQDALKALVKQFMDAQRPLSFQELTATWHDRTALAAAVAEGVRYALLFPTLRRDTLEPLLGVWPEIYARLKRPPAKTPEPVSPLHAFAAALDVDAMIAVLAACAAEPLRILSGSWDALFQKSEKQVIARLMQRPEWLDGLVSFNDRSRAQSAVSRLHSMEMLKVSGQLHEDRILEITQEGRAWLSLGAKERLKTLLDRMRVAKRGRTAQEEADCLTSGTWLDGLDAEAAVREAYARVPSGAHIRAVDFFDYESRERNPLPRVARSNAWNSFGQSLESEKGAEQAWVQSLSKAFPKLADVGALELGVVLEGETRQLTFALTPPGKYLLGLASDFTVESVEEKAAVVVQPNFDIVFTAPSPLAEAELGSFAERHGKHVGVVMKITKKSVWAAAFAGVTADRVIETLRRHSSARIPSNVEREIRGWMAQCRRATVRPAMLIFCPDQETASRVAAADPAMLTKVSDTVLELNDVKERGRVAKKLRDIGVFVSAEARTNND